MKKIDNNQISKRLNKNMNRKLLNKFSKLSDNLKKFIKDNELWIYCPACQKEECGGDDPYTWKILSKYIFENISDKEYIFITAGFGCDENFSFGNKNEIEKKIDEFVTRRLCVRSESFFIIYNFIKDKEVSWKPKIVD